ncbi:hypothetical protein BDZ89DRAFT_1079382 [Hymenopellis radicata]|nr:hypothetical protein BDZ89DRAFT_1079382 [Hymenopellis radicata]
MLFAGYSVIATMWSSMDRDAPAVSNDVYRYLLRDPLDGRITERQLMRCTAL